MEDTLQANPVQESKREQNARRTTESRRLEGRITRLRSRLRPDTREAAGQKRPQDNPLTVERRKTILAELRQLEQERRETPNLQFRKTIGYVRYADDYLIILQQHSKAEAERVKEKVGAYLKMHLHLTQSDEKTLITHPTETVKFLGYEFSSRGGRTKGLRLGIPKESQTALLREVGRLCRLHHIAEADLFLKVNALVRGWMNYYRYASTPQQTFSATVSKTFWQVCHYLAAKHDTSIPLILKRYCQVTTKNGRTRKTLRKWVQGKAIDLWLFPPKTERISEVRIGQPEIDDKAAVIHQWAKGRSSERRIEALQQANYQCQGCGTTENLNVHHRGGLRGHRSTRSLREAGQAKDIQVLCQACHLKVGHKGSFKPQP